MNAASKQASLVTAQSYLHRPPSIDQRFGLWVVTENQHAEAQEGSMLDSGTWYR